MKYYLVSDIAYTELEELARLMQAQRAE